MSIPAPTMEKLTEDTQIVQNEPVRKCKPHMTTAEKKRIVRLREVNNLPVSEIGQIVNRDPATVFRFLQKISPENQALAEFKGKEADTLSYLKMQSKTVRIALLDSLMQDAEKSVFSQLSPKEKATVNQSLAIADGIDTEKERLIRGLSTQNVLYADLTHQESEIDREIEKLRRKIERTQDVVSVQDSTPEEIINSDES